MEKKLSLKETMEILAALEMLALAVKDIAKDGIGADDIVKLIDLAKNFEVISAAVKDADLAVEELKDLDQVEVIELITKLMAMIKNFK